jgi:hypothetical protein
MYSMTLILAGPLPTWAVDTNSNFIKLYNPLGLKIRKEILDSIILTYGPFRQYDTPTQLSHHSC